MDIFWNFFVQSFRSVDDVFAERNVPTGHPREESGKASKGDREFESTD